MRSAIIYSRVSTLQQDNESAIQDLKQYAEGMNLHVVKIFKEKISGTTKAEEREEFKKLLEYVDKNPVNEVLVWEISRIGRNFINILEVIEKLKQRGINVFIKKEGINTLNPDGTENYTGKILLSLLGTIAELELIQMKERSVRGLRAAAEKGGRSGNIFPFGYKKENKVMVIDEMEANVVKMIFDYYLNGMGTQTIANKLNSLGIPTKYNRTFNKEVKTKKGIIKNGKDFKWRDGTVYGILKNSIYKGERKYKGSIINSPVIIDEEVFDKAQELLTSNYNKKNINRKYTNIFKDKIKCGYCGYGYYMHKRANGRDNAYKCLSVRYKEQCGNGGINIDKLNNAVYVFINEHVKEYYVENNEQIQKIEREQENNVFRLKMAKAELNKEIEKQGALLDQYLINEIDKSLHRERNDKINEKIKKLKRDIKQIEGEIERNINLINKIQSTNIEEIIKDVEVYKRYVSELIDQLKVFQFQDMGVLSKVFSNKQDVAFFCKLKLINGQEYPFIISRRSNDMYYWLIGYLHEDDDIIDFDNKKWVGEIEQFRLLSIPTVVKI